MDDNEQGPASGPGPPAFSLLVVPLNRRAKTPFRPGEGVADRAVPALVFHMLLMDLGEAHRAFVFMALGAHLRFRPLQRVAKVALQVHPRGTPVAITAFERVVLRLHAMIDGLEGVHRNRCGIKRHILRVARNATTRVRVIPQTDRHRATEAAGAEELERRVTDQGVVRIVARQLAPVLLHRIELVAWFGGVHITVGHANHISRVIGVEVAFKARGHIGVQRYDRHPVELLAHIIDLASAVEPGITGNQTRVT